MRHLLYNSSYDWSWCNFLAPTASFSGASYKSSGPDSISAVVLKRCIPELTPVLKGLYRLSYDTNRVPTSWKVVHVHPIPKRRERSDPSNYRSITITSSSLHECTRKAAIREEWRRVVKLASNTWNDDHDHSVKSDTAKEEDDNIFALQGNRENHKLSASAIPWGSPAD